MGYFAVKSPSPLNLWNCGKNVELPKVSKVSAIIEAGDDLVFTSALFDSIRVNCDEVCWRGIYEGLFDELAWMKNSTFLKDTPVKKLHDYEKKGNDHVGKLREAIASIDRKLSNKAGKEASSLKRPGEADLEEALSGPTRLVRGFLQEWPISGKLRKAFVTQPRLLPIGKSRRLLDLR
jgi:hypothetical protein